MSTSTPCRVLERTVITREYVLAGPDSAQSVFTETNPAEVAAVFRPASPSSALLPSDQPERVIDGVLARVGLWLIERSAARAERDQLLANRELLRHDTARRASSLAARRNRRPSATEIADHVDAGHVAHLKHFIGLPR